MVSDSMEGEITRNMYPHLLQVSNNSSVTDLHSRSSSRSRSMSREDDYQFADLARDTTSFLSTLIAQYTEVESDLTDSNRDGPVLQVALRVLKAIIPTSEHGQLILGGVGGCITGVFMVKLGKMAAFLLGAGLLTLQLFHYWEYVQIDWARIHRDLASRGREFVRRSRLAVTGREDIGLEDFAERSKHVGTGFISGFLLGVAIA